MLKLKEREPKVHRQGGRRGNERPTSSMLAPAGRGPGGIRDEFECEFDLRTGISLRRTVSTHQVPSSLASALPTLPAYCIVP